MPENLEQTLQGCFHPKEGRPNLQKAPVSNERAGQHIDKAHNNLRAMKLMIAKLFGVRPSAKDPELCNKCEDKK